MKVTFETEDPQEIKRISKSKDMALALWDIVHNGWRQFKNTDYDYDKAWNVIQDILSNHGIDVDDLDDLDELSD